MVNFSTYRGDDLDFAVIFKEGDVLKDITGWTVFFTLKKRIDDDDDDAALKKDITVHTNPTQGRTDVNLSAAETDALTGLYHYDIQSKDGAGEIKTVIKGEINFIKDISRRTT